MSDGLRKVRAIEGLVLNPSSRRIRAARVSVSVEASLKISKT